MGGKVGEPITPPATGASLARRLRELRLSQFPDFRLTQRDLSRALSREEPVAPATISSWENTRSPRLPSRNRLRAYARFFATSRSLERGPQLVPLTRLWPAEDAAREELEQELFQLRDRDAGDVNLPHREVYETDNPRLQLAARLRALRLETWPDLILTQARLGVSLTEPFPLGGSTISSWESLRDPQIPPLQRLYSYARLFATRRSFDGHNFRLISDSDMSTEERQAMEELMSELGTLRELAIHAPPVRWGDFFTDTELPGPDANEQESDERDLLLRIYIPVGQLYAPETERLLSLFREWMGTVREHSFRQANYQTRAGTVYEFFSDSKTHMPDIHEEFNEFAGFLALCGRDPHSATEQLVHAGLSRAASSDIVSRYGKETRRVSLDLKHDREQRVLAIRHSLESELLDQATESDFDMTQITDLIEMLIPAPYPAITLGSPEPTRTAIGASHGSNANQQIINIAENYIIHNVQGTLNFGRQARDVLEIIGRYGQEETAALQAAVYELEDPDVRRPDRHQAKQRLTRFAARLGGAAQDIAVDLLAKYLETKVGI
jgi:hypothetical protein